MSRRSFYVYILASKPNGTLYIGVTGNLLRRMEEHKGHLLEGFTSKYNVTKLVYAERYDTFLDAVTREKQLKAWQRKWKLKLIEEQNPNWEDLSENSGNSFD